MRLHGGELAIRSRVGEGTRVTVRLPLDCERVRPAMKRAAAAAHRGDELFAELVLAPQSASGLSARESLPLHDSIQDISVKKSA